MDGGCGKTQDNNCTRTLETKKKKKKKKRKSNDESNFIAPTQLSYYNPWFDSCSISPVSKARMEHEDTGLAVRLYYSRKRKDKECSNFNKRRFESKRFVMTLIARLYQPCNDQPEDEETKAGQGSSVWVLSTSDSLNNFYCLLKIIWTI